MTRSKSTDAHPIAVAAERTGLSQDVLRVWERRYGAVAPARGPGGQRVYSAADIDRLRLLHSAIRAGRSIGQIAQLSTEALSSMVEDDVAERALAPIADAPHTDAIIADALASVLALDAPRLARHCRQAAALLGAAAFLEHVAAPLLRRIGDEWHAGRLSPAQEHLASAVIHDFIIEIMRGFTPQDGAPRMLVATPSGERHAIGAALIAASASVHGWNVLYLGADLPAADIAAAAQTTRAQVVALSILYVDDRERMLNELRALRAQLSPDIAIIVGGSGTRPLTADLTAMGLRVGDSAVSLYDEFRRFAKAS